MRLQVEPTPSAIPLVDNGSFAEIPSSPDLETLLKKGIEAAQSGDRDRARDALLKATCLDQNSEDAWMWLASISEYPEELLAFLDHVLRINPENQRASEWRLATRSLLAKTFVQRAVRANDEGDRALAEHNLEQAFNFDANCVTAWQAKAAWTSSAEEKTQILEHILEIDPDNAAARSAIDEMGRGKIEGLMEAAKAAAAAGKRKKAVELLDQVIAADSASIPAWILRSHFSLTLEEKLHDLGRALDLEPDNVVARANYDFLAASVPSAEKATAAEQVIDETPAEVSPEELRIASQPTDESIDIVNEVEAPTAQLESAPVDEIDLDSPPVYDAAADVFELDVHDSVAANVEEYVFQPDMPEGPSDLNGSAHSAEGGVSVDESDDTVLSFNHDEPTLEAYHEAVEEIDADRVTLDSVSPFDDVAEVEPSPVAVIGDGHSRSVLSVVCCPFCRKGNDAQAFSCSACNATLSFSDMESLIANSTADREIVQEAVTQMEAEWNLRDFSVDELTFLALGHFNLRNFDAGLKYLQEAARLDPNNVILTGQANALAIRLDETSRQRQGYDSIPKGRTILVVDDSATIRKLISGKLEKCGHNVVCAADGVEAMELLNTVDPDLVLLDITMPRMDGYEVCKQIRANPAGKDLPVVMISGKDGFFDKVRGRMAGSTGYVTKPFGPETLMKALETYLLQEETVAQ